MLCLSFFPFSISLVCYHNHSC
uniref:Uncharacterized protein n=1 Tax=Rhizophora mucronata TaxID=61149 RepID=A0A2P2J2E3_RHIMU